VKNSNECGEGRELKGKTLTIIVMPMVLRSTAIQVYMTLKPCDNKWADFLNHQLKLVLQT